MTVVESSNVDYYFINYDRLKRNKSSHIFGIINVLWNIWKNIKNIGLFFFFFGLFMCQVQMFKIRSIIRSNENPLKIIVILIEKKNVNFVVTKPMYF